MKKKVKKFGAGGDIVTALGVGLIGKALYDKYKEGKGKDEEESEYSRKVREFRDSKKAAAEPAPEPAKKEEDKPMSREEYLSKKTPPIKETGTFKGPDMAEPDLEYKSKPAVKKTTTPAAPAKKAAPAAPAKKAESEKAASQSFPTSSAGKSNTELKSKPYPKDVKGTEKDPYLTSGGARNRAGMLVNPSFIAPKQASEEEVSEARSALAKRRAEQSRSFQESPLMKAISGGGSRADFYRKKREQEDAEKGMKKGGVVRSSASKRADGIAQRGKTRGRIC